MSAASPCSARLRRSASSASSRAICPSESCRSWSSRVWVSSSWARSDSSAARRSSSNSRRSAPSARAARRPRPGPCVSTWAALAVARERMSLTSSWAMRTICCSRSLIPSTVCGMIDSSATWARSRSSSARASLVGGAGGLGLVAAGVALPGEGADVVDRRVAAGRGRVELGVQPAQPVVDLGAVVASPHHAEGRIVEFGCHGADSSVVPRRDATRAGMPEPARDGGGRGVSSVASWVRAE